MGLCLSSMAFANPFIDNTANQWQLIDQARDRLDAARMAPSLEDQLQSEPMLSFDQDPNNVATLEQHIFALINQQNWPGLKQLMSHYLVSPNRDPSLVAYAEANLAESQGNLPLALQKYEQVLSYLPQFTRGKMDYARALFKNNHDQEARSYFMASMSADLPIAVQSNINLYLDALTRRNEWKFYAGLDYFRDDNINLTSDQSLCLLEISSQCAARWSAPQPIASHGINYTFSAEKFTPLKNQHGLMFRSVAFGSDYVEHKLYNTAMLNLALGYAYRTPRHQWFLAPTYEIRLEGDRSSYTAGGLMAEVKSEVTANWQSTLTVNWQDIRYSRQEEQDNNAKQSFVSLNELYVLSNNTILFGGIDYVRRKLDFDAASFERPGIRAGIYHAPNSWLDITLFGSRRWRKHDDINPLFGGQRKDTEDFVSLSIGFPKLQVKEIKPSLYVQHYETESSLPLFFSYNRTQLGLRFEKSF